MEISERGLDLIIRHEGFEAKAYKCPAGKWTIGYGHTKNVVSGMIITTQEGWEFLREDVKLAEKVVNDLVIVPLNQNQFDALVSFIFNVGSGAFQRSTLRRVLNKSDYKRASEEFKKWVFAGGKKLQGLVKRRNEEKELFNKSTLRISLEK